MKRYKPQHTACFDLSPFMLKDTKCKRQQLLAVASALMLLAEKNIKAMKANAIYVSTRPASQKEIAELSGVDKSVVGKAIQEIESWHCLRTTIEVQRGRNTVVYQIAVTDGVLFTPTYTPVTRINMLRKWLRNNKKLKPQDIKKVYKDFVNEIAKLQEGKMKDKANEYIRQFKSYVEGKGVRLDGGT